MKVNKSHFEYAVKNTSPSSMRESMIETPELSWDAVGGLEDVK